MLRPKDINKIRVMLYEQGYTPTQISRIMKISRSTVLKYAKFANMNVDIKVSRCTHKIAKYKDEIIGILNYDRLHHYKQHHTGSRVYEILKERYVDLDVSKATVVNYFVKLKKEFYYKHNGFLPLDHKPGEAQVDFGDCSYIEKGNKVYGRFIAVTFSYSNSSYIQLLNQKNAESVCKALKTIFEYLNGVPHTIWFDNDGAIVSIIKKSDGTFQRIYADTFQRFVVHYGFREIFMNPMRPNEKGTVEQAVRYMRRNLLVPLPEFDDIDAFNKELLDKCKEALKREHYIYKKPIIDLHFEDINELNKLPKIPFDCTGVIERVLDSYGRLLFQTKFHYYLDPSFAYKKIQVKLLPEVLEIYDEYGGYLMTVDRISGKPGTRWINWSPYIRLLADKPAAIYNFSFLDLFKDNEYIIEKITKLESRELKAFLLAFANMIDKEGIDEAIKNIDALL